MVKFDVAVKNFINDMNYKCNPHVIGAVVYGSYVTGYNNKKSDVDLHIIKDYSDKQIYRGVSIVDGYKIEYFEKPISDIYLSVERDFLINENAYLPIIGHGKILFDHYDRIHDLQKYILEKYKSPLPPLAGDDAKEMAVIIDNRMEKLIPMAECNKPEFNFNYYLVVEKIRKFYSRISGCPNIPVNKSFRLYTDEVYRASYCKDVPDEEFVRLYFAAATNNGTNEEKMKSIEELYNYAIRNIDIDPNNYRIKIKSRNDSMNMNHE